MVEVGVGFHPDARRRRGGDDHQMKNA